MKKKEIALIIGLLILLFIVILIVKPKKNKTENANETNDVVITDEVEEEKYVDVLNDGTKLNTSTKLNEAKEVNGLKFENIQFTEKNGQSVLLANVTNNSGKETKFKLVDVILYDKNGNEIAKVGGIVSPLQPGAKTQFNSSMTLDYANAYDFKIIIK